MILAIDPGPTQSAFVRWDGSRVIECGWHPNDSVRDKVAIRHHVDTIAIEMVASYGMAVGAPVFETCVQIGRFIELAEGRVVLVFQKNTRMHLCGSMRAKEKNIRQALIDRFGPPGTKKNPGPLYGCSGHVWSALAVAVTAWDGAVGTAAVAGSGGAAMVAGGKGSRDSNTRCKSRVLPTLSQGSVPSEHPPLETDFVARSAQK